jgi:hypothetical protein
MNARTNAEWGRVAGTVTVLTAVLALLLIAFAMPLKHLSPHDLPIAVAGPTPAATAVEHRLEAAQPGAYRIESLPDAAAARARILDRHDYGAIVVTPAGPKMLTAGAASPAVAQLLTKVAAGIKAPVTDVAPLPAGDPTGAGITGGALPLVLGGWIAALAITMMLRTTAHRVVGTFVFSAVGALSFIALEKYWFGSVTGNYLLISSGVALGIGATAWLVLGLRSALGGRGMALAAALIMLIGYPECGLTNAPELLPAPFGALGQLLPPGAAGTLLRSTAFFHGHGAAKPVLVLALWLAGGLGLFALGERRARRAASAAAPTTTVTIAGGGEAAAEGAMETAAAH